MKKHLPQACAPTRPVVASAPPPWLRGFHRRQAEPLPAPPAYPSTAPSRWTKAGFILAFRQRLENLRSHFLAAATVHSVVARRNAAGGGAATPLFEEGIQQRREIVAPSALLCKGLAAKTEVWTRTAGPFFYTFFFKMAGCVLPAGWLFSWPRSPRGSRRVLPNPIFDSFLGEGADFRNAMGKCSFQLAVYLNSRNRFGCAIPLAMHACIRLAAGDL